MSWVLFWEYFSESILKPMVIERLAADQSSFSLPLASDILLQKKVSKKWKYMFSHHDFLYMTVYTRDTWLNNVLQYPHTVLPFFKCHENLMYIKLETFYRRHCTWNLLHKGTENSLWKAVNNTYSYCISSWIPVHHLGLAETWLIFSQKGIRMHYSHYQCNTLNLSGTLFTQN